MLFLVAALGGVIAPLCAARAMSWYEAKAGTPGMGWWVAVLVYLAGLGATIGLLCFLVLGLHLTVS